MRATTCVLPGLVVLEPILFQDGRGYVFESFNRQSFEAATRVAATFVQDYQSCSRRGVLRGLHYQLPPYAQAKLVRVVRGSAFDVVVDIRRGSPTFGQWFGMILDAIAHAQIWIPTGFAHGFLALEDHTEFLYKTTAHYARSAERSIVWNDAAIGIQWPDLSMTPILAPKDRDAPILANADTFSDCL